MEWTQTFEHHCIDYEVQFYFEISNAEIKNQTLS